MPSYIQSGGSRGGARGVPPLFLSQNEKKMKGLPPPPPLSQGLHPPLFHTFKMKESGRKIETKEIPKLSDSPLLPYWYLFSLVFNFAFLVILKNHHFIKGPQIKILAKFKQTRFHTRVKNSNPGKKDSHDKC